MSSGRIFLGFLLIPYEIAYETQGMGAAVSAADAMIDRNK